MKSYRQIPAQAVCGRCRELFVYFRRCRPRVICDPCQPLYKQDHNRAYSAWVSEMRAQHRQNAREAHAHA